LNSSESSIFCKCEGSWDDDEASDDTDVEERAESLGGDVEADVGELGEEKLKRPGSWRREDEFWR